MLKEAPVLSKAEMGQPGGEFISCSDFLRMLTWNRFHDCERVLVLPEQSRVCQVGGSFISCPTVVLYAIIS